MMFIPCYSRLTVNSCFLGLGPNKVIFESKLTFFHFSEKMLIRFFRNFTGFWRVIIVIILPKFLFLGTGPKNANFGLKN